MNALVPVEQKEVDFYDDTVVAVRLESGDILVPIRPVCELIGVSWPPQRRKINDDPVMSEVASLVELNTTGGPQSMACV